jgi:hypothetical protein
VLHSGASFRQVKMFKLYRRNQNKLEIKSDGGYLE